MGIMGTRDVARRLGISASRLARAVWDGRISPPLRGPGGAFLWTLDDVERASWALLGHSQAGAELVGTGDRR